MELYHSKHSLLAGGLLPCLALVISATAGNSQSSTSSVPGSASSLAANATRIESEVVVVTNSAAVPNEIKRKPGKFFLIVKSRSGTAVPAVSFDSPGFAASQVSDLTQGFNVALFQRLNHGAVLLDLPAGEIDLKSQATGKVLLRITIQ